MFPIFCRLFCGVFSTAVPQVCAPRAAGDISGRRVRRRVGSGAPALAGHFRRGLFAWALGGAYLSLAATHIWTHNLTTAGKGWIAVGLVIFAFWRPGRALFGAWLFGGIMALQLRLQALGVNIPSSLMTMLPYALTVLALLWASWRGHGRDAPAALGVNIEPLRLILRADLTGQHCATLKL